MPQVVVGTLRVDLVANTATFTPGLDQAVKRARVASADIQQSFNGMEFGSAKGSIVLLGEELGIHLPRHLSTFLSELPGVSTLMANAFVPIAVVALGIAIFKVSEHIAKLNEAAVKAAEGMKTLDDSMQATILTMTVHALKLEDQIRAIEGRPARNKLAEALIESTLRAGTLAKALEKDIDDAKKLLEEQSFGEFHRLFSDKGMSEEISGPLQQALADVKKVVKEQDEALKAMTMQQRQTLVSGTAEQQKHLASDLAEFKTQSLAKVKLAVDASEKIVKAQETELNRVRDLPKDNDPNTAGLLGSDETQARLNADSQRVAREGIKETQNLLDNILVTKQEELIIDKDSIKLVQTKKTEIINMGGVQNKVYQTVKEQEAAVLDGIKTQKEMVAGLAALWTQVGTEGRKFSDELNKNQKTYAELAISSRKVTDEQTASNYALEVAQGRITQHAAEEALLALYTQQRKDALNEVNDKLATAAAQLEALNQLTQMGTIGTDLQKAEYQKSLNVYIDVQKEKLQITREYNAKINAENQRLAVGFADTMRKWATAGTDVMPKLQAQFMQMTNSMSGMLAKTIVEGKANWKQFAATAIEALVQIGIQALISMAILKLMDAMGIGPDDPKAKAQAQKDANFTIAMSDAAVAGTNTLATYTATGLLPVAAGMAAAAYGIGVTMAALAHLDTGGIIPNTGLAMVHKGEGVFTPPVTSALMSMAKGDGAAGQKKTPQINYSPSFQVWQKRDVANALEEHKDVLRGMVHRELSRV